MTGDFNWIKSEDEADYMYGGERFTITDEDIERLKNGDVINFFVNMEYGCTLKYEVTDNNNGGKNYVEL